MEIAEILIQFERTQRKFPEAAVAAAVQQRDDITPALLPLLEDTTKGVESGDYMAHLFAMYLLAQFRDTRALPLLLQIARLDTTSLDALLEDVVTDHLGRLLASVCGGEISGIQALIEDPKADQWVRGAALDSLVTLVAADLKTRDEVIEYFGELMRSKLTRERCVVWDSLAYCIKDLWPFELTEEMERAFKDGLIDPTFVSPPEIEAAIALGKEESLRRLSANQHYQLVDDAAKEMREWAFEAEPVKKASPKIGRNDSCPCGSGKKYKKCHGA